MKVNKALEELLWGARYDNPLPPGIGEEVVRYLFFRLQDFLRNPIELESRLGNIDDGFCVNFRGVIISPEIFHITGGDPLGMDYLTGQNAALTFGGALGMQWIDEDYGNSASANIYLFGNHRRVIAEVKDYIYLPYLRGADNVGNWVSSGWQLDDCFGEYEDIGEEDFFNEKF